MTTERITIFHLNSSKSFKRTVSERRKLDPNHIREFTGQVFGESMHAARVKSLGNAIVGVVHAAFVALHAIGQAYAQTAGISAKSGVKQVDRLLSNDGVVVDEVQRAWAGFVVGCRRELCLAMDWTDFDDDNHSTLAVYVISNHGRATPLAWRTYRKSELKNRQKQFEYDMVERIHQWLDPEIGVTLLGDRGFGDQNLYDFLMLLGWDFVIRFRGNIRVTSSDGTKAKARDWVLPTGRASMLRDARVTADEFAVPAVVVCWDTRMKEPWCLATTLRSHTAAQIVKKYGRRFTIEETFRDQKDIHFGMGLKATHIRQAARRDRLLLVTAVAHALLTLLGAAAERAGLDRYLKVNTVKRRTHSLYRQGLYWYGAIPETRDEWLVPLMQAYEEIIREHQALCEILGVL